MNTYEIEAKLNRKVDEWQYRALESTVDQQKYRIRDLENEVAGLKSSISSYYSLFDELIKKLQNNKNSGIENSLMEDFEDLRRWL